MGKVMRFKTKEQDQQENLVKRLEELVEMAKKGEITSFMVGCHAKNGDVLTGWGVGLNFGQRNELISHMQMDLVHSMIHANFIE